MPNLVIENISTAEEEFVRKFYYEISKLDKRLIYLINSYGLKIILANKLSDVFPEDKLEKIDENIDYDTPDKDKTTRGLLSTTINAICVFSDNVYVENIGAILYHEIGHLIDFFECLKENEFTPFPLSNDDKFIKTYQKELTKNWDKIKNDDRFRLKHYIQSSTPEKISAYALRETFAHCFARINNKFDDIDILGEYFEELLPVTKKIYSKFLFTVYFMMIKNSFNQLKFNFLQRTF